MKHSDNNYVNHIKAKPKKDIALGLIPVVGNLAIATLNLNRWENRKAELKDKKVLSVSEIKDTENDSSKVEIEFSLVEAADDYVSIRDITVDKHISTKDLIDQLASSGREEASKIALETKFGVVTLTNASQFDEWLKEQNKGSVVDYLKSK